MTATKVKVTPWEVYGKIDYEKLIKQFGTEPLTDALLKRIKIHTKEIYFLLRRKVFFSHRDLNWLLDEYERGNKFFLYTGRAPSGPIHIGHLLPWIFTKWLQDKFDVELWFQFPDEEKTFFEELSLEETAKWTKENMADVAALGFDPKKTYFLIDTVHASLLYKEACKVAKRITFSTAKAVFGFNEATNIGAIFYTAMQAVPAFLPSVLAGKNIPCLIPLGVDQDPHFRVARDVLPKLGFYKPSLLHCKFMPGLKGIETKMSSSDPNSTIFTTDSPEQVQEKIIKHAFSGGRKSAAEHRKLGGNPEVDIAYQYLKMFFEPDDKKLEELYNNYKSGSLLTSELKAYLIEKINSFLKQHQQKRERVKRQLDKFIFSLK